jgi:hypothetical protein
MRDKATDFEPGCFVQKLQKQALDLYKMDIDKTAQGEDFKVRKAQQEDSEWRASG